MNSSGCSSRAALTRRESRAGARVSLARGNALLEQRVVGGGKWKMLFKCQEVSHKASGSGSAVAALLCVCCWVVGHMGPPALRWPWRWLGTRDGLIHARLARACSRAGCGAKRVWADAAKPRGPMPCRAGHRCPHCWGRHITDQPRRRPRRDALLTAGGVAQGWAAPAGYHVVLVKRGFIGR